MPDKYLGKQEIKTYLTVLPEGNQNLRLNWKVYEYIGCEVYRTLEDVKNRHGGKCRIYDELKAGDKIFVAGLLGGWYEMTVAAGESGLYAEAEQVIACLEFDKDDRHCWVCSGLINKACLDKIQLDIKIDD